MRTAFLCVIAFVLLISGPHAQGTAPASPLTIISRDGRRPVSTTVLNGQEFIALDDLASLFQLTVREDALAGGLTISYKGRTIVASADQAMASVNGRVVTLPAPVTRIGRRLLVPLDFIPRALAPIYDSPIDLRRASRLLIVGTIRVARVVARIDAVGPPTRAIVEITPALLVSTGYDAGHVLVRIEADALDAAPPPAPAGLIDQIQVGNQATTISFALNTRAGTPRISTTTITESTRVTIEVPLAAQSQDTSTAPVSPGQQPPPAPAQPAPAPGAVPALPSSTAAKLQTLVIDAGHGGDDVGVRGPKGTLEKQLTLDVARKLKTLIETRLGVRVVMTRDDDRAVLPDERDAIANNSKADLFLSLHANGAPAPGVKGTEVYYLRLDRAGEEARRNVEATELVLPVVGGGTRAIDVIRWDLAQAAHVDASSRFASMLEEELEKRRGSMGPRPLQQAPMRVLSGANMPAALVEMAYLTNADEEQSLQSANFQMGLVQAMYEAVVRFRGYLEAAPTP